LGSRASFLDDFVQPIEVDGDTERQAALARVIQPFVLRRLKREVATELPERITVVRQVVPRPDQAGHYARERERAVLETRQLLASEADGARFRVLAWITRLRMLACHPAMVDPGWTGGSAKLDHALELVGELVEGGHSVLVFSQFTRHLDLVAEGLGALGVGFCRIDGLPRACRAGVSAVAESGRGGAQPHGC
jgi:SNF2 family DNA or RNA helicase